ncbi:hypothetical protein C8Q74DRAFT_673120 [Fomes fomentarius]|nr:hypothetical protein C8Q74DRAFT_673120 [Fomes fomentarius]
MTFPPLLFSASITHLALNVANGISETTTGLVQSLQHLQHLQVVCTVTSNPGPPQVATEFEAWRIQRLLTFLSSLPARLSAGLTQLTLTLLPSKLPDNRGGLYDVNRGCWVDNAVGCREFFRAFSAFRLLQFKFYKNDSFQYDEGWWRAEIATRLQGHLRAAIDVTPIVYDGQVLDLLWCTEAEIVKALCCNSEEDEASSDNDGKVLDNDDNDDNAGKDHGDPWSIGAENITLLPSLSQSPSPPASSLPSTPSTLS